jgi:hypothetical protein
MITVIKTFETKIYGLNYPSIYNDYVCFIHTIKFQYDNAGGDYTAQIFYHSITPAQGSKPTWAARPCNTGRTATTAYSTYGRIDPDAYIPSQCNSYDDSQWLANSGTKGTVTFTLNQSNKTISYSSGGWTVTPLS